MLTINTREVDFHAQVRGATPAQLVFVHGFAGDLHSWDPVFDLIGEASPALRYDLRGFGRSVCRERGPYSHAEDLLAILDVSGIEQCDLVGLSMGGSIALNFTLDHSDRVRNLVLISPGLKGWEWSDAWQALWRPIVDCARAGSLDEAKRLWWEHPLFATTRATPAAPTLYQAIMQFSGEQWISDLHAPALPDVERLHQLNTRTLLMSGGRDLEDFRLIADLVEASATDLQRIDFSKAGHLIPLEEPQRCAAAIESFLADGPIARRESAPA